MHRLIVNGELFLYGFVGEGHWDTDYFTARDVLDALALMSGDIVTHINSGGGIAMEGLAIYNALKMYPGKVTIIIDAGAMSTGSLIAMAGDKIIMSQGSLMMIHDPSIMSFGNADETRSAADVLDKQADRYAAIYAERAGISASAARDIMKAETWFTAEEAVAAGFADELADGAARATALFDYRLYPKAPSSLTALAMASASMFTPKAAPAAQPPKETSMDPEVIIATQSARLKTPAEDVRTFFNQATMSGIEAAAINAMLAAAATMVAAKDALLAKLATMRQTTTPAVPAVVPAATMTVADVREVMTRGAAAGLDLAQTNAIMAAHTTRDAAFAAIIDEVATMRGTTVPVATAKVIEDARDKFREGASLALMLKAGVSTGERNEFSGLSLSELARESLMIAGVPDARRMDRMLMVGTAFMAGGMHSTSDFGYILQNVAQKSALKGYGEADETFEKWTSSGAASDFKPIARVDLGLFPNLEIVQEGGEYKYGKIGDRGVTVVIATYGKLISITRQAIINDDLSILGSLPIKMGRAAKRTVGNLVYAVLVNNPNFADGVALFHANHGNLAGAGAVPSEASWQAGVNAMGSQKDGDAIATALNIRPKYFLSGAYEFLAKQLLTSTSSLTDSKNAGVANTVQGLVEPITDRRITGTQWFLAADPNQADTIEVTYLDGNKEPVVESKDGWTIDGTELKVRLDAGVNPLDFRGLYKNPGA